MLPKLKAFPPNDPSIAYARTLGTVPFNNNNITAFTLRFSPEHAYSITSGRYQPARLTLFENYAQNKWNARTEPFWWSSIARRESTHLHSTVRGWMARKVRHAVTESLRKQGFRADGTRLDGSKGRELYGTAQFTPEQPIMKMPFTEVVKQMDVAVSTMIELRAKRINAVAKVNEKRSRWMDANKKERTKNRI